VNQVCTGGLTHIHVNVFTVANRDDDFYRLLFYRQLAAELSSLDSNPGKCFLPAIDRAGAFF
jgi:hypothetical protein